MERVKTKTITIPFFPSASEIERAEKHKARLENEGYGLIHTTACKLIYQKAWEV